MVRIEYLAFDVHSYFISISRDPANQRYLFIGEIHDAYARWEYLISSRNGVGPPTVGAACHGTSRAS